MTGFNRLLSVGATLMVGFAAAYVWQTRFPSVRNVLAQSRAAKAQVSLSPYTLTLRESYEQRDGSVKDASRILVGRFEDGSQVRIQTFLDSGFELIYLRRTDGVSMRALGREKLKTTVRKTSGEVQMMLAAD